MLRPPKLSSLEGIPLGERKAVSYFDDIRHTKVRLIKVWLIFIRGRQVLFGTKSLSDD